MDLTIELEYKLVSLQMAAEAFLIKANGDPLEGNDLVSALERGNLHSSRFTAADAENFVSHWRVVAQQDDTSTGFSGTLFECILGDPSTGAVIGEKVISFRSTEFIDDAVRDNQETNSSEIKETGWASIHPS